MMQALDHLMAVQQQQQNDEHDINLDVASLHLNSAIANMHSFAIMMDEQNQHDDGRNLVENNNMKRIISGTEFRAAVMGLLTTAGAAAVEKNHDSSFDLKSLALSQQYANIVKQGIKDALVKLHLALEQMSDQELQDLSRRLVVIRNDNAKMVDIIVKNNPVESVPIAMNTLARLLLLDQDDIVTAAADAVDAARIGNDDDDDREEIAPEELLALIWVMPVSVVAGTFFWAVAGLDTYDDYMTPFQIWIFEIVWVAKIIGCAIDNDFLCTAADDDERSSSLPSLPFIPDENQEDGSSR
jgi:hypothetical protein